MGKELTIAYLERHLGVQRACADDYISFVEMVRPDLESRVVSGRKHWFRPDHPTPSEEDISTAAALDVAVRAMMPFRGTYLYESLVELQADHRDRLRDHVDIADRRARSLATLDPRRVLSPTKAEFLKGLLDAVRERRVCIIEYGALNGSVTSYDIEPWSIVWVRQSLFLLARRIDVDERRTFELDGIRRLETTSTDFTPPTNEELDADAAYFHAIGSYTDYGTPNAVHLRIGGLHAVELARRVVHHSQQVSAPDGDGWVDVRFRVVLCPEFLSFVLGMLPHVRVISPKKLADEVAAAVAAYLRP